MQLSLTMLASILLAIFDYLPATIHISYFLAALAYILKNILWLRIILVCSSSFNLIFNFFAASEVNYGDVFWHSFFILINSIQAIIIVNDILGVRFTTAEKDIFVKVFSALTPVDFHKLVRAGKLKKFNKGDILARENKPIRHLYLIYRGQASVDKSDHHVADIGKYAFVGEMAFVTHNFASATVTISRDSKVFVWDFKHLGKLMKDNPDMQVAFQSSLGTDMAKKLGVS